MPLTPFIPTVPVVCPALPRVTSAGFAGRNDIVNPPLAPIWGSWSFGDGTKDVSYSHLWDLEGCWSPTTYTLVAGALPTGLVLNSLGGNQGSVNGTPTVLGTFVFTLRATNLYGAVDKAFSITISAVSSGGSFMFLC